MFFVKPITRPRQLAASLPRLFESRAIHSLFLQTAAKHENASMEPVSSPNRCAAGAALLFRFTRILAISSSLQKYGRSHLTAPQSVLFNLKTKQSSGAAGVLAFEVSRIQPDFNH
jgi:hypothetical protein